MSTKTNTVISINGSESLKIERATKSPVPNYYRVGNGTKNKENQMSINLLQELVDSTKAEQYIIIAIVNGIGYDNDYSPVVNIVPETETEKKYLKLGYKSLFSRNLVRRVKRGHYMINPNALIPVDYDSGIKLWHSL